MSTGLLLQILYSVLACVAGPAAQPIFSAHQADKSVDDSARTKSSERTGIALHARPDKLDLELSASDGLILSDQLMQPLFGNHPDLRRTIDFAWSADVQQILGSALASSVHECFCRRVRPLVDGGDGGSQ